MPDEVAKPFHLDTIIYMAVKQERKANTTPTINNKKSRFNFDILETVEAGLMLVGTEVKSVRAGKVSLEESYIRIIRNEPYLVGANIQPYDNASHDNHDPIRNRKLLLHKAEIKRLLAKVQEKHLTIVPLRMYFNSRGLAKIKIGLAKGKALHDKRRSIRDRDQKRDVERQMRKYR